MTFRTLIAFGTKFKSFKLKQYFPTRISSLENLFKNGRSFVTIWQNDRYNTTWSYSSAEFLEIWNIRVPGVIAVTSSFSIFKVPGVKAVNMLVL